MKYFFPVMAIVMGVASPSLAQEQQSFSCIMQPSATVKLGSSISGILDEISVELGDRVKVGQALARLESDLQEVELGISKLRSESAFEESSTRARLKYQDSQVDRVEELYTRNLTAEADLEEQKTERELAALEVKEASLQKKLRGMEVLRAQELLELRHIRSPVDGVVIDATMRPGEFVHEQSVIMTVAALDPLIIEAFLPVEYYDSAKVGDLVTIEPDAPIGGSYQAAIKTISQVFDAASGTFGLRMELPNPELNLPGGLRCQLYLAQG
ncbi:MAG: efflux RND transporter periplasmic adaptor subunit [Halioglobus sp.]